MPFSTPEKKTSPHYAKDLRIMSPRNQEEETELNMTKDKGPKEPKVNTFLLIKATKNYFPGYLQINEK